MVLLSITLLLIDLISKLKYNHLKGIQSFECGKGIIWNSTSFYQTGYLTNFNFLTLYNFNLFSNYLYNLIQDTVISREWFSRISCWLCHTVYFQLSGWGSTFPNLLVRYLMIKGIIQRWNVYILFPRCNIIVISSWDLFTTHRTVGGKKEWWKDRPKRTDSIITKVLSLLWKHWMELLSSYSYLIFAGVQDGRANCSRHTVAPSSWFFIINMYSAYSVSWTFAFITFDAVLQCIWHSGRYVLYTLRYGSADELLIYRLH